MVIRRKFGFDNIFVTFVAGFPVFFYLAYRMDMSLALIFALIVAVIANIAFLKFGKIELHSDYLHVRGKKIKTGDIVSVKCKTLDMTGFGKDIWEFLIIKYWVNHVYYDEIGYGLSGYNYDEVVEVVGSWCRQKDVNFEIVVEEKGFW